jgi:Fe-S cluster biogenesis protein NfuA
MPQTNRSDLAGDVRRFIDAEIRPAVNEDGGEVTFEGMNGREVRLCMSAACATCPARHRTAQGFIQRRLRERFGGDITVSMTFKKWYFA